MRGWNNCIFHQKKLLHGVAPSLNTSRFGRPHGDSVASYYVMLLRSVTCLLFLMVPTHGFKHGWNTVTDMLGFNPHASGNGRYNDSPFAMKHWKFLAENNAVLVLSRFEDFDPTGGYNCSCPIESSRTKVARILKKFNPNIKLLWYAS